MWNDTYFHINVWTIMKKKFCFLSEQPSWTTLSLPWDSDGAGNLRQDGCMARALCGCIGSELRRAPAWFHLEIRNNVWGRALHFHFVLGLQNYVCLVVGYVLCFLAQTSLFLKAEKRHWYRGKRRRLSGGKRACGGSGSFGEICFSQGLCATSTSEWEMRCVVLSLGHSQLWLCPRRTNTFLIIL